MRYLTILFTFISCTVPLQALAQTTPLFGAVQVSDSGVGSNTIESSNTSRNIAVSPNGTIYVVYRNPTEGIVIKKSTDRGETFSSKVQISTLNAEAEVATSSNGSVYVVWADPTEGIKLVRSTDNGATFSAPTVVDDGSHASVHMAVDGSHVYVIGRAGASVFVSNDSGATFNEVTLGANYVFSDVLVDLISHTVVVQKDNPNVIYHVSTDFGATFSTAYDTQTSVFYSVGSLLRFQDELYLVSAGNTATGVRVKIGETSPASATFPASATLQGRSLSADVYGNVAAGYSVGSDVQFSISQDGISTAFPAGTTISGTNVAEAALNTTNGDVMFVYEQSGQIFLNVYAGLLTGYDLELSVTSVDFSTVPATANSEPRTITITNTSNTTITFSDISVVGEFTLDNRCGTTLASGASCAIDVRFAPTSPGIKTGSVLIDIVGAGQTRTISVSGIGDTPPPATATPTQTATPTVTPTFTSTPEPEPTVAPTVAPTVVPTVPPTVVPTAPSVPTVGPTQIPQPERGSRFQLSGRVLNADGNPSAGVLVCAEDLGCTLTDGNGDYVFVNAVEGRRYRIEPKKDGENFEPRSITAVAGPGISPADFAGYGDGVDRSGCSSTGSAVAERFESENLLAALYGNARKARAIASRSVKAEPGSKALVKKLGAQSAKTFRLGRRLLGRYPMQLLTCTGNAKCERVGFRKLDSRARRVAVRLHFLTVSSALVTRNTAPERSALSRLIKKDRGVLKKTKRALKRMPKSSFVCQK